MLQQGLRVVHPSLVQNCVQMQLCPSPLIPPILDTGAPALAIVQNLCQQATIN